MTRKLRLLTITAAAAWVLLVAPAAAPSFRGLVGVIALTDPTTPTFRSTR
jgi:hypothetical protein